MKLKTAVLFFIVSRSFLFAEYPRPFTNELFNDIFCSVEVTKETRKEILNQPAEDFVYVAKDVFITDYGAEYSFIGYQKSQTCSRVF